MTPGHVPARELLEGGINWFELAHYLFAGLAGLAAIAAGVVAYLIIRELNQS